MTSPTGPIAANTRFRALYRFATGALSNGQQRAEDAAAIGNHALVVIAAEQRADHIDPEQAVAIAEA